MNNIRDALYCCAVENTRNAYKQRYGKGILVGMVCILMTRYRKGAFKKAIRYLYNASCIENAPFTINSKCIPNSWLSDFKEYFFDTIQ